MSITTHVLDTSRGRPAAGVGVTLEAVTDGAWASLAAGVTDDDGRLALTLPDARILTAGVHRLVFETGPYFQTQGTDGFYPEVAVTFEVRDPDEHYHVPLLLSPFGYSSYRGS